MTPALLFLALLRPGFFAAPDTVPDTSRVKYFNLVQREASFPGGVDAWNAYVSSAMKAKMKYLRRKNAWGTAEVQYSIEPDGSLGRISITQSSGTDLDKVILEILEHSPKWIPAIQHDRPIPAFRRQKISVAAPN